MLTYLIQLTICWMILFIAYLLFLKRETFFQYNRWYLLSALILGLVVPLMDWAAWFSHEPDSLGSIYITPVQAQIRYLESAAPGAAPATHYIPYILIGIYGIGVLLAGLRMAKGIRDILSLRRKATILPRKGYELVLTHRIHMPFSFWNAIYWSEDLYEENPENNKILLHETKHVRALHSLDVLFLEILCVLFWFHPFVHIYRAELRQIHEYEADAAACLAGSKKEYGQILIHQAQSGLQLALANHFFYSQLKNRIKMITKKPSHQNAKFKYLLAVPFLALTALLFSFSQNELPPKQTISSDPTVGLTLADTIPSGDLQPLIIIDSKKWDKEEGIRKMNELDPASIQSIDVLKDHASIEVYGEEGKNGVIRITTKEVINSSPEIEVNEIQVIQLQDPEATNLSEKVVIGKKIDMGTLEKKEKDGAMTIQAKENYSDQSDPALKEIIVIGHPSKNPTTTMQSSEVLPQEAIVVGYLQKTSEFLKKSSPLIIVDDIRIGRTESEDFLKKIDPATIESINVLKGEAAIQKYQEEGVEGVIEIHSKIPQMIEKKTQLEVNNLKLYPNPATHQLKVDFDGGKGDYRLDILDITGALQLSKSINNTSIVRMDLDISPLNSGMYYLLIQSGNQAFTMPFVKE